jgi:hypothetical protein
LGLRLRPNNQAGLRNLANSFINRKQRKERKKEKVEETEAEFYYSMKNIQVKLLE